MKKNAKISGLAKIIRNKRKSLGWSLLKLEHISGVRNTIISKIESGLIMPDKHGWRLAKELGISFNIELFAKQLKNKRGLLGWSVLKLAKASDVSLSSINTIENGKKISMELCYKLAKALDLHLEDFIICNNSENGVP